MVLVLLLLPGLAPGQQSPKPATTVTVSVDPSLDRRAVNPEIYGVNFGTVAEVSKLKATVRRWGGNLTTRYSWIHDVFNHASDYLFYNLEESSPDPATLPDNSTADLYIDETRSLGAQPLMTVPILGWVPKDRVRRWSFSIAKYGPQTENECTINPFDGCNADAGNGIKLDLSFVVGNDPTDTAVPSGPAYDVSWLQHIRGRVGSASQGGVKYYSLDNEPALWNSTHRDVHPLGTTFDEVWQKGRDTAAAIKAYDPAALVTGPAAGGDLRVFPADQIVPATSVINFGAGQTRANNALLRLSADGLGRFTVQDDMPGGTVHLILDVNGYFQ